MTEINIFRRATNSVELEAGEIIFDEGDEGDLMFAVIEGHIELSHDGLVLETVGPGGILGELALIDSAPRSATALATTDARIVPVSKKDFLFLVQEHPTFALKVMTVMSERLRRANALLRGEE